MKRPCDDVVQKMGPARPGTWKWMGLAAAPGSGCFATRLGTLDPAFQAQGFRLKAGIGGVEQEGVEPAVMLDRADGIDAETQAD